MGSDSRLRRWAVCFVRALPAQSPLTREVFCPFVTAHVLAAAAWLLCCFQLFPPSNASNLSRDGRRCVVPGRGSPRVQSRCTTWCCRLALAVLFLLSGPSLRRRPGDGAGTLFGAWIHACTRDGPAPVVCEKAAEIERRHSPSHRRHGIVEKAMFGRHGARVPPHPASGDQAKDSEASCD